MKAIDKERFAPFLEGEMGEIAKGGKPVANNGGQPHAEADDRCPAQAVDQALALLK